MAYRTCNEPPVIPSGAEAYVREAWDVLKETRDHNPEKPVPDVHKTKITYVYERLIELRLKPDFPKENGAAKTIDDLIEQVKTQAENIGVTLPIIVGYALCQKKNGNNHCNGANGHNESTR